MADHEATTAIAAAGARRPRLTERLLGEDLPRALTALDDQIEYIDAAVAAPLPANPHRSLSELRQRMTDQRASLARAREWLAGTIEAVTQQRTEGSGLEAVA